VKTIRSECRDHFVIVSERHPRHLIEDFIEQYPMGRYHQGIGSPVIKPKASPRNDNAMLERIECRSRLGGLWNYYHRKAA